MKKAWRHSPRSKELERIASRGSEPITNWAIPEPTERRRARVLELLAKQLIKFNARAGRKLEVIHDQRRRGGQKTASTRKPTLTIERIAAAEDAIRKRGGRVTDKAIATQIQADAIQQLGLTSLAAALKVPRPHHDSIRRVRAKSRK